MSETAKAIRAIPADVIAPAYVVWELTLKCDLACGHCGSRAGHARPDELSTAEALGVVRDLAALGSREVTLIGGEAYLREDWDVIAAAVRDHGMACTMTTGGRNLTLERTQRAQRAGVRLVSVSIDGIGPTHDRQRGVVGSYAAALAALENLRAAGVPAAANTQVNRLSFGELDAVLDVIAAHGARAWQVQATVPMGRAADHPDWLLQPHDYLEVVPKIAALRARAKTLGVRLWPGNNIGYFGPHESALRGDDDNPFGYSGSCSAGIHTLGLEADGSVKGCPSLPTAPYTGGNVRTTPLAEIWARSAEVRFARDRTVEELWGFCRTCYYADICRAGCSWTAHVIFGKRGNNPYCHHRALELEKQGLRERLVPATPAPGVPFDHGTFELVVEPLPAHARPLASRPRPLPLV